MLVMYLGTIEISAAVAVNRKVSRVAATVADLVTQQIEVEKSDLKGIMEIGECDPVPLSDRKAVDHDRRHRRGFLLSEGRQGRLVATRQQGHLRQWRVPQERRHRCAEGSRIDGSFLIRVDASLDYVPIVNWLIGDTVGKVKRTASA
jgi:hypothetical protein